MNRFILSCALLVKPLFDRKSDIFKFIGLLQPIKKNLEYIVTDVYGSILGMTQNLSKLFNVFPKDYEKNDFYIQILCPKLYSFFLMRNERVNDILYGFDDSNGTSKTNRTNTTKKFKVKKSVKL